MTERTIAIAGLGAATLQIHLPACAKLGLRVMAGCDPMVDGGGFSFPVFTTVEEMLDRVSPAVLIVATPTSQHYGVARRGLLSGCHVFCEKPFMNDLDEAKRIVELAQVMGRQVVVNNQYRFMRVHSAAKERIGQPDFGQLLFLSARQTLLRPEPAEAGWRGLDRYGTFKEFGTHVLDLCRFFFDEDPWAISARMPRTGQADNPDHLDLILLEFSGDRVAQITLDRLARGPHRYLELQLDGTRGCIESRLGGAAFIGVGIRGNSRKPYVAADFSPGARARLFSGTGGGPGRKIAADPLDIFAAATSRLLKAFLDALDSGDVPPCHARDNLRTLALMLAAYESADRRQSIEMHYGTGRPRG